MHSGKSTPLTDPTDLRFRMSTLKTGSWLALGMISAALIYFALSWNSGNRPLLSAMAVGIAAANAFVLLIPRRMERIVAGTWREAFFLAWTMTTVAVLLIAAAIDPVKPSPLTLPLLMPMLFAGMSYPRRSARVCCMAVVSGYGLEALVVGEQLAYSGLFLLALVGVAGMCLWQAENRERQHAELERQRDELARVSRADPLTDALNRRGFEERFELELAEARRSGRPLAIAVLDLDDFKRVNDRAGHAAGDELLQLTVSRMREALRPMDAVGRLGGDEFAVLFPGAGAADAEIAVANLRTALAGGISASTGHSVFPADGVTATELLGIADRRLYAAKSPRERAQGLAGAELSWAAALADAVDRRMNAEHPHSRSVADYSIAIASQLGWSGPLIEELRLASTLHDVGKVSIPDRILNKPGDLDAGERAEMQRHSTIGAEMLSRIDGLESIVALVRHSHEHFDGSGYPDGLAGPEIPAAARVLLTADAFDAMTSDRPYRRALSREEALAELRAYSGSQFDPECVTALIDFLAHAAEHDGDRPPVAA